MEQILHPLAKAGNLEAETIQLLQNNPDRIPLLDALIYNTRMRIRKLGGDPDKIK